MQVDQQNILTASKELASQIGLSVSPPTAAGGQPERTLSSCVKISGSWQGAILLECSESIARHAAVMLFAADAEETPADDIQDAVKELADMFGKKLKPYLPEETKISRPSLVQDESNCKALVGMQGLTEMKMSCEGHPVRIALFHAEPVAAAG
jgi:CheY-specific phosphatase CheX